MTAPTIYCALTWVRLPDPDCLGPHESGAMECVSKEDYDALQAKLDFHRDRTEEAVTENKAAKYQLAALRAERDALRMATAAANLERDALLTTLEVIENDARHYHGELWSAEFAKSALNAAVRTSNDDAARERCDTCRAALERKRRCPAALGNAGQCVKEAGHDGQHSLIDVSRP